MNRSSLNKSAFGATAVLGFLILVSLLAYHRQAELAVIATLFTSGLAGLVIHLEMQGRRRAEMGLHRSRLELEDRVAERTAEINTANVALQAEVFERQRVEEALRKAHDELEVRVDERTRELADANAVLNREILERRQITDALKNSRALYHSLVEHLPIHVWRTDITGRLTFANQHLCEALGVHQEEILGRGFSDFYTAAGAQQIGRADERVRMSGEKFEEVLEFESKAGRHWFEQVLMTPFHDSDGRVLGVQAISWDVTERKRGEEEMHRIQTQLERTNADLRRKNEEIQSFYHTLSHELKTPLTSAREFVAIVRDGLAGELNGTQREYLGIALESCNQLRVCLNDLLDATRLETGKLSIDLKPGSLGLVAQRVATALRPAAEGKRITLDCEVEAGLPDLPIDERRISQVVANLLTNALKFTEPGGRIQVQVARAAASETESLLLTVTDSGRGIPAEQCDRIFDRLYQVPSGEATTEQGVGLGLYICRELVQLHGGSIAVESALGAGSTFTVTLPLPTQPVPARLPGHRPNLLLVDDDPSMRDILRFVLEKAHFEVATAEHGQAALRLMEHKLPDVVLMDLEMPVMDGSATLEEIRKHWGAVPVVLHTGHIDGPLLDRAMEWSPQNILAKPCPMEHLVQTVRAADSRSASREDGKAPAPLSPKSGGSGPPAKS